MRDNPIMMSGPMVQACLRQVRGEPGGKTQTRRMPNKAWDAVERRLLAGGPVRLWVRETWKPHSIYTGMKPSKIPASNVFFSGDEKYAPSNTPWVPSIHMPRWASRLTLLDVTIRRERLGDISRADALAEGVEQESADPPFYYVPGIWPHSLTAVGIEDGERHAERSYAKLWNHLHGPGSWERDADKEVMVIGFRPMLGNIDKLAPQVPA